MTLTRKIFGLLFLEKEVAFQIVPNIHKSQLSAWRLHQGFANCGLYASKSTSIYRSNNRLVKIFPHQTIRATGSKLTPLLSAAYANSDNSLYAMCPPTILKMSTVSSNGSLNPNPRPRTETTKEGSSTNLESEPVLPKVALSNKDKLKQAVRDYGATVIIFHVAMSLSSLGFFYLLVQSGLDVVSILTKLGISEAVLHSKVTEEAGKFVVAYAVHKVFAPVRITITLTVTPFLVKRLRTMGILKEMKKSKKQ